jgi:hypothetical protein
VPIQKRTTIKHHVIYNNTLQYGTQKPDTCNKQGHRKKNKQLVLFTHIDLIANRLRLKWFTQELCPGHPQDCRIVAQEGICPIDFL